MFSSQESKSPTDSENLLSPISHRLPIFKSIFSNNSEADESKENEKSPNPFIESPACLSSNGSNIDEFSTRSSGSFGSIASPPNNHKKLNCDFEDFKIASRIVKFKVQSRNLSISEISKIWNFDNLEQEDPGTYISKFNDIRNSIYFMKQVQKIIPDSCPEYIFLNESQCFESAVIVKCEKKEYFCLLRKIMEKVGQVMEIIQIDAQTGIFKYFDIKTATKMREILQKFAEIPKKIIISERDLNQNFITPIKAKSPIQKSQEFTKKSNGSENNGIMVKNVEKYCGIKKRNTTEEEREFYKINIEAIICGSDQRTTVMIKNIPNKYTQKLLIEAIDKNNKGSYNFFYLPIDFKNKCNVGYAFINFKTATGLLEFYKEFNGKKWNKFNSEKICSITYGRVQGFKGLVEHFRTSNVMYQMDPRLKPIIFED